MKNIFVLLAFLIVVGICIPAVSANIIINETLDEYTDTSEAGLLTYTSSTHIGGSIVGFYIKDVALFDDISYFTLELSGEYGRENGVLLPAGRYETTYTYAGVTKPAVLYISRSTNLLGQVVTTKYILFPQNWDRYNLAGSQAITTPIAFYDGQVFYNVFTGGTTTTNIFLYNSNGMPAYLKSESGSITPKISHATAVRWVNHLTVTNDIEEIDGYEIKLDRTSAGINSLSTISIYNYDDVIYTNTGLDDIVTWFPRQDVNTINVTSPSRCYTFALVDDPGDPGDPDNTTVTVYVRNSQTYALLANANIVISASVNGTFHEVVNETVPSGIYSIELQPTGGGMPNPDFYRLITTAEGYISVMPYMDFEVDGATTIYDYLDPIAGAPEDENKTFIDFFVRDLAANAISGATVNFGGYTLITNSAGYAVLEVDKNNTYSWIVSKSGYGSLTGNAVIGSSARHTINSVIAPTVTPTTPTPIPTSTSISPTPTMTAPNGEPVSNWLEWFAAHFGRILGGGVEIGKIFMWLCFSLPVGVYVAKESRAGAAGFMAGAGVVTLFFVLIGWVPIWLLVFLALIIGLLYAKVFNNSDTGGGR